MFVTAPIILLLDYHRLSAFKTPVTIANTGYYTGKGYLEY
jgi:hypothetical protein